MPDDLSRRHVGEAGPEVIQVNDILSRAMPGDAIWPDLTEREAQQYRPVLAPPRSTPDPMPASAVVINARHILSAFVDFLADACRWVATRVGL